MALPVVDLDELIIYKIILLRECLLFVWLLLSFEFFDVDLLAQQVLQVV